MMRMSTPSAREAARALVTLVVPVQIDLVELGPIDAGARLRTLRLVAVGDQQQGLPSGLEATHVLAVLGSEHDAFGPNFLHRLRRAARRPFGSNGIRRFSLSLA